MTAQLSRRALASGALGLVGLATAVRHLPSLLTGPSRAQRLIRELVNLVAVTEPIAVGRFYFAAQPGVKATDLVPQVLAELPLGGPVEGIRQAFRQKLVDDFEAGRTIRLDGWYLSETEAQLCALVALEVGGLGG